MFRYLSECIYRASVRWEWFDDLVDLVWRGRCYSVVVLAHSADSPDIDFYCDYLDSAGPWRVALYFKDDSPYCIPGEFDLVDFRGWSLLRWCNSTNHTRYRRSGYSFDPVSTLEA